MGHYGISWDEPTHFKRGQAYLRYFLTGETTYKNLPDYDLGRAKRDPSYHERSFYQIEAFNFEYHLQRDGDHPVLNDILAAFSNFIFYQKLGVVGDIAGYHLFEIFISAVLVAVVFLFAAEAFGLWAGFASAAFMATYPLFWAESHFNIKDPAETAFFALTVYTLWRGIHFKKAKILVASSFFAGFALATKLNILFLPFILLPWIVFLFLSDKKDFKSNLFKKRLILAYFVFPLIMFSIFYAHWPFLWQDFVGNTKQVFNYYKGIGTETNFQPNFLVGRWNTYATTWILFTTQPLMLLFFILGVLATKKFWQKKSLVLSLWIMWFLVPILRVTIPGTTIYSGSRQIMEFIPAMALISGVGFEFFMSKIIVYFQRLRRNYYLRIGLTTILLLSLIIPLIRIHPNENVYFNFLTGGLSGAVERGIPAAGFSFGNAYWQGVQWLSKYAPEGSKVALIQGTNLNVPPFTVRPDITSSNYYWSDIERQGEYLMELTYASQARVYHYPWEYVEKILIPVHEVAVDGVPILIIWKNDLEHTRPEYRKKEVTYEGPVKTAVKGTILEVVVPVEVLLSKVEVTYSPLLEGCTLPKYVSVETSLDGTSWTREGDTEPDTQVSISAIGKKPNLFRYYFAARVAKFLRIDAGSKNPCLLKKPLVELLILK